MSSIAKLKKDAAEFEQKRQFDKALARYQQILELIDEEPEEADVALFNRVGDLMLRQGNTQAAVGYYERAVDLYTESGFFNNAIALCNKILRNAPGRSIVYYKLGCISAKKGFFSDAKQNFLEYAERMRKSGQIDEAFRALKEFADLCPEQDDIRVVLADQLVRDGRKEEAIEQLQLLFDRFAASGRESDARATLTRMKAIDPSAEPRSAAAGTSDKAGGLVFLDPHDDSAWLGARRPTPTLGAVTDPTDPPGSFRAGGGGAPARGYTPPDDLPLIAPDADLHAAPMPGIEHGEELFAGGHGVSSAYLAPIEGIERGAFDPADPTAPDDGMLDIEPTRLAEPAPEARAATPSSLDSLPLIQADSTLEDFASPRDTSDLVLEEPPAPFGLHGGFVDGAPSAFELAELEREDDVELPLIEVGGPPGERQLVDADEPPAADRVAELRAQLSARPDDHEARRRLGESLVEQGEREAGLAELDTAMVAFERAGDLAAARSLADEIVRVDPDAVRFHQKRVEYAFRTGDRTRLVDAYLALADALVRGGELTKARAVYGRVYELAPDDPRARVAVDTMGMLSGEHLRQATPPRAGTPASPAAAAPPVTLPRQAPRPFEPEPPAAEAPPPPPPAPAPPARQAPSADFVDLSDWLREDEKPKSTRMIAEGVHEPEDGQDVDFQDMLERFKQGVAANVEETDYQSHHDLGIAYREMGLLDEAISEFQKALRADGDRVRTYEALGQCFVDKGQHQIAVALLRRALDDHSQSDDTLIGVLYLLGASCQALGRRDEARDYFERVFAVDIGFRDVRERLAAVEAEGARA